MGFVVPHIVVFFELSLWNDWPFELAITAWNDKSMFVRAAAQATETVPLPLPSQLGKEPKWWWHFAIAFAAGIYVNSSIETNITHYWRKKYYVSFAIPAISMNEP